MSAGRRAADPMNCAGGAPILAAVSPLVPLITAGRVAVRSAYEGFGVALLGLGIVLLGVFLLVLTWRRRDSGR